MVGLFPSITLENARRIKTKATGEVGHVSMTDERAEMLKTKVQDELLTGITDEA
jgi:hypothetical protein